MAQAGAVDAEGAAPRPLRARLSGGVAALTALTFISGAAGVFNLVAQSPASATAFGMDHFMAVDGNILYASSNGGSYGWSNSGPIDTNNDSGNLCSNKAAGGVFAAGTGGLFNCGQPNPLDTASATFPPLAPNYVGPAIGTAPANILAEAFIPDNINSDTVVCPGGNQGGSNIFGGGEKTNTDIGSLSYSVGSATPKDQISNVYAVARKNSLGQVEVYVGGERVVTNGDTHMDFEFLQHPVSQSAPCAGSFSGTRSQGDFMLEINYDNGGTNPTPAFYVWECTGSLTSPAVGTPCTHASGADWVAMTPPTFTVAAVTTTSGSPDITTTGNFVTAGVAVGQTVSGTGIPTGTVVDAVTPTDVTMSNNATANGTTVATFTGFPSDVFSINTNTNTTPISCGGWVCRDGNPAQVPVDGFMEGAVNLGGLSTLLAAPGLGCATTFWPQTRSAGSGPTSQIKAFAAPQAFGLCNLTTQLSTSTAEAGITHVTDQATLGGSTPVSPATVTYNVYSGTGSGACTGTAAFTDTESVTVPGVIPQSKPFSPSTPGHYEFQAVYNEDGTDPTVSSVCGSEPLSVVGATIGITKTADHASVDVPGKVGFTVTVSNSGNGGATGVAVTDTLPSLAGLSWSIDSGPTLATAGPPSTTPSCSIATGVLSCSESQLAAGDSFSLHIISSATTLATAAATDSVHAAGVVYNLASVTTTNDGHASAHDQTQVLAPSLGITKTADGSPVDAGNPIGFTVTLSNTGTGDATGVTLSDPLPGTAANGISWTLDTGPKTSIPTGISCGITAGTLSCGAGSSTTGTFTLPASTSVVLHVTSPTSNNAQAGVSCGTWNNTATYTSTNDGTNHAGASVTVDCPTLAMTKSADATTVDSGGTMGFTVTLSNNGNGDANGATLSDPLPGASGSGVNWSLDLAHSSIPTGLACAVTGTAPSQTLSCGASPSTSGSFTLGAGKTITLHVTSPTSDNAQTGVSCGTWNNTASFTSTNDGSGSESASVTVVCPAIGITKTADSPTVDVPGPAGFTITVANTGAGDATGVAVTDTLPSLAGLSWTIDHAAALVNALPTSTAPSCSITGFALSCTEAILAAGDSFSLHITSPVTLATALASDGVHTAGVVYNLASVTTTNDGHASAHDQTQVLAPGLGITKTADNGTVDAGSPIGFTVTLSNTGSGDATNVTLSDPLPGTAGSGLSWTLDSSSQTKIPSGIACAITAGTLSCGTSPLTTGAFTLPAGQSVVLHVTSPTSNSTTASSCGVWNNTATYTSLNDGTNHAGASVTVDCPTLVMTKTADSATAVAGSPIGFTVTLHNSGNGDAHGVTLSDPLPSASGSGISWSLDTSSKTSIPSGIACAVTAGTLSCGASPSTTGSFTLATGGTVTLHVTSPTSSSTTASSCGVWNNTASFTSSNDGSGSESASVTVECPALALTKTADHGTVAAGSPIGFTVTLTNSGGGDATGVTLTDPLPGGVGVNWSLDSSSKTSIPSGIACAVTGTAPAQVLSCGASPSTSGSFTLRADEMVVLHVTSGTSNTATSMSCGVYDNTASFTSANGGSGSQSASVTVDNCTLLTAAKNSVPAPGSTVSPGQTVTYTITLSNAGKSLASAVTVTDAVPAGTTYVASSASCGGVPTCTASEASGTVTWLGIDVPAATGSTPGTVTVSFQVTVDNTDTNNQVIPNFGLFTNEHTPSCTGPTCPTNTVTLTVVVPATLPASSPPPAPKPIVAATEVHTGKPWAGARPFELLALGVGLVFIASGELTRRRYRLRRATPHGERD